MSPQDQQALFTAARAASQRAYAKYSNFQVGAALWTIDHRIFTGCNVENRSYGLTICAERSALFTAVAEGQRKFSGLAIASPGAVAPCGACLQVLSEFAEELPIWLLDSQADADPTETSLAVLLPHRFDWNGPAST